MPNGTIVGNQGCNASYILTAKFEEVIVYDFETENIEYESIQPGLSSGSITVPTTNVDVSFAMTGCSADTTHSEIQISNGGSMVISLPEEYEIRELTVRVYGSYDNLIFYSGTSASGGALTETNKTESGYNWHGFTGKSTVQKVRSNSSSVYITSTYSYVKIMYVSLKVAVVGE